MELQELDVETLGALLTGGQDDIEDYLEQTDLPVNDLEALRAAEAAGRDRGTVLDRLDEHITAVKITEELNVAEDDVETITALLDRVAELADIEAAPEDAHDRLDQMTVLALIGGAIDDIETFLEEHALSAQQIAYILEAEQRVKDRDVVKDLLRDAMHDRVLAEDLARVREDLDELTSDVDVLADDAVGDVDGVAPAPPDDAVDLEEVAEEVEKQPGEADRETAEERTDGEDDGTADEPADEAAEDEDAADAEEDDGADDDDEDADMDAQEDAEDTDMGVTEQDEDGDTGETEDDAAKLREELVDVYDADPDVLAGMDVAELREKHAELERREELIDVLVAQFHYPRSRFAGMTLSDLEKITDNLTGDAGPGVDDEAEDEEEADDAASEAAMVDIDTSDLGEKMPEPDGERKKGAEHGKDLMSQLNLIDLKKSFGPAVDDEAEDEEEADEDEEKNVVARLLDRLPLHHVSGAEQSLRESAMDDLERATELDDAHRASLIVAHVMKQFLELKMEIPRELTYLEVPAELENSDLETGYADDIRDFYERMHLQEYKGEAAVDFDRAYELAENVIADLS